MRTKLREKMLLRKTKSKMTEGDVLILYDLIVEQMLNRIIQGPEFFWDSFFFFLIVLLSRTCSNSGFIPAAILA